MASWHGVIWHSQLQKIDNCWSAGPCKKYFTARDRVRATSGVFVAIHLLLLPMGADASTYFYLEAVQGQCRAPFSSYNIRMQLPLSCRQPQLHAIAIKLHLQLAGDFMSVIQLTPQLLLELPTYQHVLDGNVVVCRDVSHVGSPSRHPDGNYSHKAQIKHYKISIKPRKLRRL